MPFLVRFLFAAIVLVAPAFGQISMRIDASDAPRNIVRVRQTMPAKPGDMQLFYPKWIPGEHSPTGTLNDIVRFEVSANGKPLEWRRDDVEMFAFHVDVPAEVDSVEVAFDYLFQPYGDASANLARLKWNRLVIYPRGARSDDIAVTASLKLPPEWKFASALPVDRENGDGIQFKTVSLTEFVDSPAIIGRYFKRVKISSDASAPAYMNIVAESVEALNYKPATLAGWQNLVFQAETTFGARHYRKYDFLLTLSDEVVGEGLEHHESSENGVSQDSLQNPLQLPDLGELLGHEYAHSWNGKYRRPAMLATPDFEQPMHGELLWVYEGLTQYLGKVLTARSGLWTFGDFRESFAELAADLDGSSGRRWRPLVDTARAVQFTYDSPYAGRNMRRSADYYDEGALIWLEADVIIRNASGGKRSLDDFLKKFHGGESGPPAVVGYTFEDVIAALEQVQPYDWRKFFVDRVYKVNPRAPTGGIENAGWKLEYSAAPNKASAAGDFMFSIGLVVSADGEVIELDPDLPAGKAGIAIGMYLRTVNGNEFTLDALRTAVASASRATKGIEVLVQRGGTQSVGTIDYSGGLRYPHLVRDPMRPNLLAEIIRPVKARAAAVTAPGR